MQLVRPRLQRIETVTDSKNKKTNYTYDKSGNRETETVDGKKSTYYYNSQNRLEKVESKDGTNTANDVNYQFEYDKNGNELKEKKVTSNAEDVILENVYNEWDQAIEIKSN